MTRDSLVLLGSGYITKVVLPLAIHCYRQVLITSRHPDLNLTHVTPEQRILFNLEQPETWTNIPQQTDLLWCFPAAPLELVRQFAAGRRAASGCTVVLGSTSAYDVGTGHTYPPPWIDETAPIDMTKARVQGEEYLRKHCHAVVLRVAGIYGPGRHPLDWIRTGRVGPSRKFVNLIHVHDLAAICLAALERGTPGGAYNVSDGLPRTWQDICDRGQAQWGITPITSLRPSVSDEPGKRLSNSKLTHGLGYTIQHPDLFEALAGLRL